MSDQMMMDCTSCFHEQERNMGSNAAMGHVETVWLWMLFDAEDE